MNTWQSRAFTGLIITLALFIHAAILADAPNTVEGMLVFHGTAATADLILLRLTPLLSEGQLCDDMQWLFLLSIAINFLGWLAYLNFVPGVFYNAIMGVHCYVQAIRLSLVDGGHASSIRGNLVHSLASSRA